MSLMIIIFCFLAAILTCLYVLFNACLCICGFTAPFVAGVSSEGKVL